MRDFCFGLIRYHHHHLKLYRSSLNQHLHSLFDRKKELRKMFNFPFWKIPFQLLKELESQPSSYKVRKLEKLKYWKRMFGEVCGNFTHSFKWENETYVFDHELECTVSKTVFVLFTLIGLAGLFGNSLVVLGE